VHDLRVASRRAAAAMDLFSDLLPERRSRRLVKLLRRIRRAAGKVRDTDVLAWRWASEAEVPRLIQRGVERTRRRAQKPLAAIDERLGKTARLSRRVAKLLAKLVHRAKKRARSRTPSFGQWAAEMLSLRVRRFFEASRTCEASEAALHGFGISGKDLRYTMEILAGVFPEEMRRDLYPVIELVQGKTGLITDHAVACHRLEKWLHGSGCSRKPAAVRRLLRIEKSRQSDARQSFTGWWTPDRSGALHRRFQALLCAADATYAA